MFRARGYDFEEKLLKFDFQISRLGMVRNVTLAEDKVEKPLLAVQQYSDETLASLLRVRPCPCHCPPQSLPAQPAVVSIAIPAGTMGVHKVTLIVSLSALSLFFSMLVLSFSHSL